VATPPQGPETRAIRLTVIAHASPRWRGAAGAADADQRNLALSQQREQNVRVAIERVLRAALGAGVPIYPGVSRPDHAVPRGVEVGGYAVGSRDSLAAAKGDRRNDDAAYRKVEVVLEEFTTSTYTGGRSLPTRRTPARIRKWWSVRVDRLYVNYIGTPTGEADLRLTNGTSNKSMRAKVKLSGTTGYMVRVSPSPNVPKMIIRTLIATAVGDVDNYQPPSQGDENAFGCNREMGFGDFNGQTVTFEKTTYTLGITGYTMSMTFDNLGPDTAGLVLPTLGSLGMIGVGHYKVSGPLQMVGPNPGDWADEDPTEAVSNDFTARSRITLTLTFPTGKSRYEDTDYVERFEVETLVEGFAKRFLEQP
jgi:hypothetical protein